MYNVLPDAVNDMGDINIYINICIENWNRNVQMDIKYGQKEHRCWSFEQKKHLNMEQICKYKLKNKKQRWCLS